MGRLEVGWPPARWRSRSGCLSLPYGGHPSSSSTATVRCCCSSISRTPQRRPLAPPVLAPGWSSLPRRQLQLSHAATAAPLLQLPAHHLPPRGGSTACNHQRPPPDLHSRREGMYFCISSLLRGKMHSRFACTVREEICEAQCRMEMQKCKCIACWTQPKYRTTTTTTKPLMSYGLKVVLLHYQPRMYGRVHSH
jgi:hypothetical protein